VVSRAVFSTIGLLVLYRGLKGVRLRRFAWSSRTTASILKIGVPSCLQWVVRMASYLYVMNFVSEAARRAGEGIVEAQAAFSVGLRLDSLALFSGIGWGAAAATFVGQSLGRGLRERAVQAAWIALGLNMAMMLLFAVGYGIFPDALLRLMGFDVTGEAEAVRRIGRTYLYVASSGFVFLAVAVVLSQALAGAGATKFPLLVDFVGYGVIGIPLTWWATVRAGEWGLRGLWLATVAIHLLAAVAYLLWFRFGAWARKEIR
jgi:Na+-driven multidrug efflux pump